MPETPDRRAAAKRHLDASSRSCLTRTALIAADAILRIGRNVADSRVHVTALRTPPAILPPALNPPAATDPPPPSAGHLPQVEHPASDATDLAAPRRGLPVQPSQRPGMVM